MEDEAEVQADAVLLHSDGCMVGYSDVMLQSRISTGYTLQK